MAKEIMNPKTKTVLFIVISFILGILGGIAIEQQIIYNRQTTPPPSREEVMKAFADRLHLDSLQVVKVDTILSTYRPSFDEHRKRVRLTRDTIERNIRAVLSPDQNKLYDDYLKDFEQHERKKGK
jgi:uncharacterized membrane protein